MEKVTDFAHTENFGLAPGKTSSATFGCFCPSSEVRRNFVPRSDSLDRGAELGASRGFKKATVQMENWKPFLYFVRIKKTQA